MQDLHHSDVLSYAISRIAAEYSRDQAALVNDLKFRIREANHRGLGTTQHLLPDDAFEKHETSAAVIREEDPQETLPRT